MEHEHVDLPLKQTQITFPSAQIVGEFSPLPEKSLNEKSEVKTISMDKQMEPTQEKPKHKPTNLFDSKEEYLAFKKQWSKLANEKKLTSAMMMFYNIVRGKDASLGFTRITNQIKLANGHKADGAYISTFNTVKNICLPKHKFHETYREEFIKLFDDTIDDEFVTKVSNYMASFNVLLPKE